MKNQILNLDAILHTMDSLIANAPATTKKASAKATTGSSLDRLESKKMSQQKYLQEEEDYHNLRLATIAQRHKEKLTDLIQKFEDDVQKENDIFFKHASKFRNELDKIEQQITEAKGILTTTNHTADEPIPAMAGDTKKKK
jgi:hypothetical protein